MSKNKKKNGNKFWSVFVFILTLILSGSFSALAFWMSRGANLFLSILLLIILIFLSMLFDLVGVSVAACDKTPFISMCSKKVRGARMSLMLLQKADKVACICNDVVGDVIGIVSGALGTAILVSLELQATSFNEFVLPIIISALIAAATVLGKSFSKSMAMKNPAVIVRIVGRMLSIFVKNG